MNRKHFEIGISRPTSKRLLAIGFAGALALSGLTACSSAPTEISPSAASTPSQVAEEAEQEVTESAEPIIEREPTRVAMSFADGITSQEVRDWIDAVPLCIRQLVLFLYKSSNGKSYYFVHH